MKKLYFLLILFHFLFKANAQWVTIPDSNFVAFLQQEYPQCMNGNQMDTTCSAIVYATHINCSNMNISDLTGIQYFDSLEYLSCSGNQLTTLPPLPDGLKDLECELNQLTVLPNLPDSLTFVNCNYNQLTTLPALPNSLVHLLCHHNQLTSLPQLPSSLHSLFAKNNQLTSMPLVSYPSSLYDIDVSNNLISGVILDIPDDLVGFYCSNNQITSIFSLNSSLYILECSNNQITSLPALPQSLNMLRCEGNQLISLPELPLNMTELIVNNNPLNCLPQLTAIGYFNFNNTNVQCLSNYGNVGLSNPTLSTFPICDPININNCSVYWNISGKVYEDQNQNCLNDINETKLSNVRINLFKGGILEQYVYTDDFGMYNFYSDTGTFTYSIDSGGFYSIVSCPSSGTYTSTITSTNLYHSNKNFGVECASGFDVGVKNIVSASGQFFPANYSTVKIGAGDLANFYGLSCAAGVSGTVTININGPVTYISEAPGALIPSVTGNTILTYNVSDFGTVNFNSDFEFIIQTDTLAQAGNLICVTVNVTPVSGDNDTTNNSQQHCFTIVNSFDPNDKQVFPSGVILPDHEWLTYTIRFQNTGTAPAQHIYILDTLDTNLDVSTFTLLSYSHDNLTQALGDVVKFNFPNINLPDSTNDEPNSHGYVQYKIKLIPNLPIGTTISNTAYNFFDFNPPVATNTVVNQIYFLNPTITPNNLILCPNESDTLWTQVYDNYQWFKDGNLIPGANNQYLVVDYFNYAGSQVHVEVDSAGVIAQSAPVLVDGWAFLPPFVIQDGNYTIGSMGEMIICPGDTAYLILGLPYDTNIQWTDNGIAIPNANSDTLIITQAGLYNVTGSPAQCPNYVQSLFDDVQVVIAPPLSPTITPNSLILCPNESDTLWTQQFGNYQWYKDGNLIPGATNQYLVVSANNDAGSQFSVEVSQGNCTGTSSQVLVDSWVFLLPFVISEGDFTTGPNGEMLVCPGDTAYLILGQPYDTNIQWTNNGNIIPGATDDTLVITQSGMYHVSGAPSTCPNFIQNLGVTIEVIVQGPPQPIISYGAGNLITDTGYVSYSWTYNGNPVSINNYFIPSQGGGGYMVTVTDANGCTAESQIFIISSIIENSISGIVNINYNQQTSTLVVTRSIATAETEIIVLDVIGRVIADKKIGKGVPETKINLSGAKPGIYFVRLSEGEVVKIFIN